MNLPVLQEMLELSEADLVATFKKSRDETRSKIKAAVKDGEAADADAEKEAATWAKQNLQDDLAQFVADFFTKFPNYRAGEPEQLKQRYPTQGARDLAQAAFKAVATRIESLRQGLNRSVVSARLVKSDQVRKYNLQAKRMMGANAPAPPSPLVSFVKTEARFFKRLVRINNNGELNDENFKELLELKMKQTVPERAPDAVQALNLLFAYMYSQFNEHAKVIQAATMDADDAEREERMNQRRPQPPAAP